VPTKNLGLLFGLPADTFDDGNYWQRGTVKTDSYGIFLQGSLEVTPTIKLTAGARYNYEKRAGVGRFTFDAVGIDIPTDRKKGWSAVTPKFLIEWTPSSTALIYGTITRGFKSGVINVGSTNSVIDPEYVWNYEAGFKLKMADNRLLLSGAAFYYDYTNLQVGFVNAQSIVETINAASARNYGAELELNGRVTNRLSVNFYGAYLNAKFSDFCNGYYGAAVPRPGISYPVCPTDPGLVDLKGKRLPNAPKFSFGGGFDYKIPLARGDVKLGADVQYQAKIYFTEFNNSDAEQSGYALVNAKVGYHDRSGWSVTAWARNLGNKYAIANNIVAAPTFGQVRVGSVIAPRTYGATVGFDF
jgi:iron complex outermembrane receptor protein